MNARVVRDAPEVVVSARPIVLRWWCTVAAVLIVAAFTTTAAILRTSSDGVTFHLGDQIAVAGVGLAVAGLAWLPTRPRLRADHDGVEVRGLLGAYKRIPWTMVRSVEFRPKWRWARLVLPADETISLYAVQRSDGARAVTVMRALRALHAAAIIEPGPHRPSTEPTTPADQPE